MVLPFHVGNLTGAPGVNSSGQACEDSHDADQIENLDCIANINLVRKKLNRSWSLSSQSVSGKL